LENCSALLFSVELFFPGPEPGPGLPDISWYNIQKRGKLNQENTNYVMLTSNRYTKRPLTIPRFSTPSPSQMYQNWDFVCENIPSGNPGKDFVNYIESLECQGKFFTPVKTAVKL
jgi:hypothetical protein